MKDYLPLEKKIGIHFDDQNLIDTAFVHKSSLNETGANRENNERLEFLGDAVLELVVTEYLYHQYQNPEGELTNWRSALVKGKNLARISQRLGLGEYLYLSKGEEKSGGRHKDYILGNTMEALIGAIYLDKSYEITRQFILKHIIADLRKILNEKLHIDAKSHLQEIVQKKSGITPEYTMIKSEGPDHEKTFVMAVYFGEERIGTGKGKNKQAAEQDAAERVLKKKGWDKK